MPWAAEGAIYQDHVEGGVEITETQYLTALQAMCDGKVVTIANGFRIVAQPAQEEINETPVDENRSDEVDING